MRAPLRTCSEFPELSCRLFSELHQRQSMRLHRATVGYISVHLSLYYSTNEGCRVSPGTPVSLRFVPHAHGSEVRSLPLIITVLLRSRFAHALRSLVSQRKRRAAAHNRVVLGSENPSSRSTVNQGLGDAVAIGVLGKPAIALCAVPLLIPVSALICAQERP